MPVPTVFIGSSSEQLPTARALKTCLSSFAEAIVWDEAVFDLNESIFGGLLQAADKYDFGVFVFDADDVLRIRHAQVTTVRDNVLFELGLFTGRMGKGRAFWISAQGTNAPHIPTDLAGITHLSFARPSGGMEQLPVALEKSCERLRIEIDKLGPRSDRTVEELNTVRILCAASSQYSAPKFAADIAEIQRNFPPGSVQSAHGVDAQEFLGYLSDGRKWDIVHLAMYVDPANGDLLIPSSKGPPGASGKDRLRMEGVEKLIQMSQAKLVVVVTCDSLVLAAGIARLTNTIAGYKPIDVRVALDWSSVFYRFLAQGCPLSEAFNRAQALTDPGLLLIARRDFRLKL